MTQKLVWISLLALSLFACRPTYHVTNVTGSLVKMDTFYDVPTNERMQALVKTYKTELDKEMNEVIGTSARFMDYKRPESLLTNLTADVMKAYGDEQVAGASSIGVMNVHGHRATLPKGEITVGNLYEIYSFDNTITFLRLKGSELKKIFDAYARIGGAGISSNVKLLVEDRKVKSVTVDGHPVDEERIYNIVTVDYLAEGNDNMNAFRDAVSHTDTGITLRDVMIQWVKEQTRLGNEIDSELDGRITLVNPSTTSFYEIKRTKKKTA